MSSTLYDITLAHYFKKKTLSESHHRGGEMVASRMVVLWHKIVLSPPIWFLVEIVAKKPWKWSLYSSLAFTSFLPILTLTVFTLASVLSGLIVLFLLQFGLLALAIVSFLSSVAFLVPAAFTLTLFIYLIYKCVVAALCALCWILALPTTILRRIKPEAMRVCMRVSEIISQLCFWQNTTRRRENTNSEVRSKAAHKIRKKSSPLLLYFRRKSKGWWAWLKEILSDSNISDGDRALVTCPHGYKLNLSSDGRYYELSCEICTERGSTSCSSSDEETIKFTSGSGSDSYHTADEWLVEDYFGNIIPDYRDRETKMYEALLKRDFCTSAERNNYY